MIFGDFPEETTRFENARVTIVPVPYDGTSTWIKGADKGPDALLESSYNMEFYDIAHNCEIYPIGIHTTAPITENSSPEAMSQAVYHKTKALFEAGKYPVIIGGEHSVSIGAIQAAAELYDDITIVQFDAHADLREEYIGSSHNHACVMARAREVAPIIQIGIRSISIEEQATVQTDRMFYAEDIHNHDAWIEQMVSLLTNKVYITFDLDAFDSSVMPSTGTPEPGGMLWYQVLKITQQIFDNREVVGMDIVELCPNPTNKAPDFLAARLLYTMLTQRFAHELK